ncbi:hypothetical protein [Algibacillus agarilyticus]|uniref:hypothetical protein n=1 Tax=Algibacillus agarilyticus TaxID=2234133 RepID=UPI000DD028E4|nr:hypothetical protein [Algibacillus agarilyticus]
MLSKIKCFLILLYAFNISANTLYSSAPYFVGVGNSYQLSWSYTPSVNNVYAYVELHKYDYIYGQYKQINSWVNQNGFVTLNAETDINHNYKLVGCVITSISYIIDCNATSYAYVNIVNPIPPENFQVNSTRISINNSFKISGDILNAANSAYTIKILKEDLGSWNVVDTQHVYSMQASSIDLSYTPSEKGIYKVNVRNCIMGFCGSTIESSQIEVVEGAVYIPPTPSVRKVTYIHTDILGTPVAETH